MIIGLTGLKRSGKDTTADYLVENYGFTKYSLADPMKVACKEIFLLSDEQLWGNEKEVIDPRYGVTPRQILQIFGTELFQYDIHAHLPSLKIKPRYLWINRFKEWYEIYSKPSLLIKELEHAGLYRCPISDIVIADVRFQHEAEIIREMGGMVIRVVRYPMPDNGDKHASETELLEIDEDYTLYGMNDIPTLYKEINKLIKELRK